MIKLFTEVKYSLLSFFRNKGAVFWTCLFPIVILLLLGYVMGGGSGTYVLYYNDSDGSATSHGILQALNNTTVIELKDGAGMDLQQQLKDGKIGIYIEIPAGFEQGIARAKMAGGNATAPELQIYYDKTKPSSLALISIISEVINGLNMRLASAVAVIDLYVRNCQKQAKEVS